MMQVKKDIFDSTEEGKKIYIHTLENDNGIRVSVFFKEEDEKKK